MAGPSRAKSRTGISNIGSVRSNRTPYLGMEFGSTHMPLESPRDKYYDRLHELAIAASIPLTLPAPMFITSDRSTGPHNLSDKAGAESFLMTMRQKKFLVGKSSKGFTYDEIMLGLSKAVIDNESVAIVETLLQFVESSDAPAVTPNMAFTKNKKGHTIPTIDYVFSQAEHPQLFEIWHLFLGRVSQHALDNSLARALKDTNNNIRRVHALLERGANAETCQESIMKLLSSEGSEEVVEAIFRSPTLSSSEFFNQALVQAASRGSVRNSCMLLLRGADANFNHGNVFKLAVSSRSYNVALALATLSQRAVGTGVLDDTIRLIEPWNRNVQKPYLIMLLYAGASGPRTSRVVMPYIADLDNDITSFLVSSCAFGHGSFPVGNLFQVAIATKNTPLALNILHSSNNRSLSDYMSTGVHLDLVRNYYKSSPNETLTIISELLKLGVTGDYTSQMLISSCERNLIGSTGILALINLLIEYGGAKADYEDGKALLLAIETAQIAIVNALITTHPSKKILNAAVSHVSMASGVDSSTKLQLWSILLHAGASGQAVDHQLSIAVDRTPIALDKVKILLPVASLDYSEGEAIVKAIQLERLDILETCLATKKPQSSMASIWKQTRRLFDLDGDPTYKLAYMQKVFEILYNINKETAPLNDLLHDAAQCKSKETAWNLSSQLIHWGASPDYDLGASLIACVTRSDSRTLALLLGQKPTKRSLRYTFEKALLLPQADRYEILKMIIEAGAEKANLDAALPQVMKSDRYDPATVQLLIGNGARLHSSWSENLIVPANNLDIHIVETLLPPKGGKHNLLSLLMAVMSSHSDWDKIDGQSISMVKLILANVEKGTWADQPFITQVKGLNQNAARLFVDHVSSKQTLSNALSELLSKFPMDWTQKQLSLVGYLLGKGAGGDFVDKAYIEAIRILNYKWVVVLDTHLVTSATTRTTAFEMVASKQQLSTAQSGARLEIIQFLLKQGVTGPAVDHAFIASAAVTDTAGLNHFMPYVSSPSVCSEALSKLTKQAGFTSNHEGREAVKFLIQNGASEESVLNCVRSAAKAGCLSGVQLIAGTRTQLAVRNAAFEGLMDSNGLVTSSTGRLILSYLLKGGLGSQEARQIACHAALSHDITLMEEVAPLDRSGKLCDVALSSIANSGDNWLSTSGLSFVDYLLRTGVTESTVLTLVAEVSKSPHLMALRLLLNACSHKRHAANIAFAGIASNNKILLSAEGLAILEFLLEQGANSTAVINAAAHAAKTSNYEALNVFLQSSAAALIIPITFKAVTRDKSKHLSSSELSIATILVKNGVSTEILSLAAIETTKLLDLGALTVLSRSPRFASVTDDALRELLSNESQIRSPDGLRIMQFLMQTGVTVQSMEMAVTKAASTLDIDTLRILLESNLDSKLPEIALTAMIGLEAGWLCPEGLRITELLIQGSLSQSILDKAFIQACQYLCYDAVQLLYPYIAEVSVANAALAKATSTETKWFSELRIIEKLLENAAEGDVIESALVKSAQALDLGSLKLLSQRVTRGEAYSNALAAAQTNDSWRQSLEVIDFLLSHGAREAPVDAAFISAASCLDYEATLLLAARVENGDTNCQAFSNAVANSSWLSPNHFELISLLYNRKPAANVVEPALIAAAKVFNVAVVQLLAKNADEHMASAAFTSATVENNKWQSPKGVSILEILIARGAQGDAVDQALISGARQLRIDIVQIVISNVDKDNLDCFSAAFDAVVSTGDQWLTHPDGLDILQIFIDQGTVARSAHNALVDAAQIGNLQAVKIIGQVVDDNTTYSEAFNALTISGSLWLQHDTYELLEHLLSHGAYGESLDNSLIAAIENVVLEDAPLDLPILLLNHNADVNFQDGAAFRIAAMYRRSDLFEILLQHGPNSTSQYMALKEALCNDHDEQTAFDLVRLVASNDSLEVKPDVNHDSDLGSPLIFYCLMYYPYSTHLAKEICDLGANLAATISWTMYGDELNLSPPASDQVTPLIFAIEHNASDEVVLNILFAYGADYHYMPPNSRSNPLVLASRNNRALIVSKLLDHGARIGQKDCYDRSALFYAARNGDIAALTSLLKKTPLPNDGSLHEAARELHADAVRLLVAAGHDISFPSPKHGGRNALCELCFGAKVSDNATELHDTLSELMSAKSAPLRKFRGRTALFYAIENENPVPIVTKLIEVCLWRHEDLNDPENVFLHDNYFYSATMYIKKGITHQQEANALEVLEVLQDASTMDRFYAQERMQQPEGAVGMPQRIADLDHKKWIRSSRLEDEQEEHRRKLARETEEMNLRDQLTARRHILTMQHREDLARQTVNHNTDAHWQGMQFRSIQHEQDMRYKDDNLTFRTDDIAAGHRLKFGIDEQVRDAQYQQTAKANQQRLGYIDNEQELKHEGARSQQLLRLEGISNENTLKNEQQAEDLAFKRARATQDVEEMDNKLRHATDLNTTKIQTQSQMENIARESYQAKIDLEQRSRASQLEYHEAIDDRKVRTESTMNQLRQDNNDDTIRARARLGDIKRTGLEDKNRMMDNDRRSQLGFNVASDRQRLDTLHNQGRIQNDTLFDKGKIENHALHHKNGLLQDNRYNELHHTASMGQQRIVNERGLGQQRIQNEQGLGQVRLTTEQRMGAERLSNTRAIGAAQVGTQQQLRMVNQGKLIDGLRAQQMSAGINHARHASDLRFQRGAAMTNHARHASDLRFQQGTAMVNHARHVDDLRYGAARGHQGRLGG